MGEEEYSKEHLTVPVTTEEYGFPKAASPFNSRFDKSKLVANQVLHLFPTWQDASTIFEKQFKEIF